VSDYLKAIENEMASEKLSRGEGTGIISRVLSVLQALAFVYIYVQFFKDNQLIPLIIMLGLGFTRFCPLVLIILLIYFVVISYWSGLLLILIYGGLGLLSVWSGLGNIKKNIHSRKANINPFNGMGRLPIYLILVIFGLSLLLSGFLSIISWFLLIILSIYVGGRYYLRLRFNWCKIHYSLMVHYSEISGCQAGISSRTGEKFNIEEALKSLVKIAYNHLNDEDANSIIRTAENRMKEFSDRDELIKIIHKKNPLANSDEINDYMEKTESLINAKDKAFYFVRYVIAEIISKEYGEQERIKYIYAVMTRQAG